MEYIRDIANIEIESEKCIGCGNCIEVCPHAVIGICDGIAFLMNKDGCMECGACSINCSTKAIKVESGVGCANAIISSWFLNRQKGKGRI